MTKGQQYQPKAEHKFSFGLWTLGNVGRDPFGDAVRPVFPPVEIVATLAEVGAWGVNLHDNDLVPIDATPAESGRIVREFAACCKKKVCGLTSRIRWTGAPATAARKEWYAPEHRPTSVMSASA